MVALIECLYRRHKYFAGAEVNQAAPGQLFGIINTNLGSTPIYFTEVKAVAKSEGHFFSLTKSKITYG